MPPSFSGAEPEDAQDFFDRCQCIFCTMGILETNGVSFTTFKLSGDAFRWWEDYERRRLVGAASLLWHELSLLFSGNFVPQSRKEELRRQFEQLFWLVSTEKERVRRFIDGLHYYLGFVMTRESVSGAMFNEVVDIARRLEMLSSSSIISLALPAQSSSRAPSVQGSFAPGSSSSYSILGPSL
uniref:Uncharacterized protein LOC104214446 n=1 Tax=Nicotiana sylvestris TaxID=4096 RepID=A0A1U7V7N6_NICSY|nr:PREDICTED: uncharacterized protein LOC104214446 [Nicotiana sylvestris]